MVLCFTIYNGLNFKSLFFKLIYSRALNIHKNESNFAELVQFNSLERFCNVLEVHCCHCRPNYHLSL